jgi:undecaprenyl diphosphate synthase
MNAMIAIAEKAKEMGIPYLTVYALSTENLARPKEELDGLYDLFRKYFMVNVKKLKEGGASVKVIGAREGLPEDILNLIDDATRDDNKNPDFTFIIALNYGSRNEIARAVNEAVNTQLEAAKRGESIQKYTTESLSSLLYTSGIPDPDLIIRTGGEKRLSNFLTYQAAYAELYFTDVLFPDFDGEEFEKAIQDYSSRTRRFGKV